MITAKKRPFEQAVEFLPMFKDKLLTQSPAVREKTFEIRLRAGQPVTLELGGDARLCLDARAAPEDLRELIERFCDYSIHSYARQLSQGFVTLEGGHRAGFCGTAVMNGGKVDAIRDITSINLRIAREFIGCSDTLFNILPADEIKALLIIGKPMSAKTTLLRDFARNISMSRKVAVVDERGELASKRNGVITADLGPNTDVLDCFPKRTGFITALRALSPDFIICDEIAGDGREIAECLNSGVGLVMTAHCGSLGEALCSQSLTGVIAAGVNYIALLGTGKEVGKLKGLWRKDLGYENGFRDCLRNCGVSTGLVPLGGA